MDLKKLLAPRTVAIVGASEKEGFGGDTCRNVMAYADKDRVYFINPKRETVFGKKCWPTLDSLPEDIDLVVICTPQKTVEDLLRQAAAKGCAGRGRLRQPDIRKSEQPGMQSGNRKPARSVQGAGILRSWGPTARAS